jgi:hypothetical protein
MDGALAVGNPQQPLASIHSDWLQALFPRSVHNLFREPASKRKNDLLIALGCV